MTTTWMTGPKHQGLRTLVLAGAAGAAGVLAATAIAHAAAGQPVAGQLGLQDSVTTLMDDIRWFHNSWVNPIIIAITAIPWKALLRPHRGKSVNWLDVGTRRHDFQRHVVSVAEVSY